MEVRSQRRANDASHLIAWSSLLLDSLGAAVDQSVRWGRMLESEDVVSRDNQVVDDFAFEVLLALQLLL